MTRIAVFSDSHGNAHALGKVVAALQRETFDNIVCLGDAIQGGPQPAECVALLRDLNAQVVMGNADHFLLHGAEEGDDTPPERLKKQLAVREWQRSKLSGDDLRFIETFQPTYEFRLDGMRTLLCFHGSPQSFDEVILPTTPEATFQKYLAGHLPSITCGGHTHMPQIRRIGASDSFFFNPGAVGFAYSSEQPEDNFKYDAFAEYAVLTAEDGRISLDLRRVPYDVNDVIRIYEDSGRPYADEVIGMYTR